MLVISCDLVCLYNVKCNKYQSSFTGLCKATSTFDTCSLPDSSQNRDHKCLKIMVHNLAILLVSILFDL